MFTNPYFVIGTFYHCANNLNNMFYSDTFVPDLRKEVESRWIVGPTAMKQRRKEGERERES